MNHENAHSVLGTPVSADITAIEQELSSFWRAASEKGGAEATVRACSSNLVTIVENQREAEALPPVVAKLAETHPSRAIVAYQERETETPPIRAWVLVQCTHPFGKNAQVCSELITVGAYGETAANLPNILLSLLVPDLPVFLYWRSLRLPDRELAEDLARFSHLLIVDSRTSKDDPENRERLLELLTDSPGGIALRDLNWSRVTVWRDLIAQFFDAPVMRAQTKEITEVEIRRVIAFSSTVPSRSLLLTGWLASRLNWQRISARHDGAEWISRWNSSSGEVRVRFLPAEVQSGPPGISSVTLRTRRGDCFAVISNEELQSVTATASGQHNLIHKVPHPPMDEASLLAAELSLSGEDPSYTAALQESLALERIFHRS